MAVPSVSTLILDRPPVSWHPDRALKGTVTLSRDYAFFEADGGAGRAGTAGGVETLGGCAGWDGGRAAK